MNIYVGNLSYEVNEEDLEWNTNQFFLGIEDSGTRVFMLQQFLYRVDLITN